MSELSVPYRRRFQQSFPKAVTLENQLKRRSCTEISTTPEPQVCNEGTPCHLRSFNKLYTNSQTQGLSLNTILQLDNNLLSGKSSKNPTQGVVQLGVPPGHTRLEVTILMRVCNSTFFVLVKDIQRLFHLAINETKRVPPDHTTVGVLRVRKGFASGYTQK